MSWVFSEVSAICFAVPCVSPNPMEALVIQLIHVWWFSSNQMEFHSMPEQIDIQQQTQHDCHEDFWSIFSINLSSLFILCSTDSKHFSLPKLWLLWSHSSKTGVLCLRAPSCVTIHNMPPGKKTGKSWCLSHSFSFLMDKSPGMPVSNIWK